MRVCRIRVQSRTACDLRVGSRRCYNERHGERSYGRAKPVAADAAAGAAREAGACNGDRFRVTHRLPLPPAKLASRALGRVVVVDTACSPCANVTYGVVV